MPGLVAQWVACLTHEPGVPGLIPGPATYLVPPSAYSRRAVVSCWPKYVHEVVVNHKGGLSLPRKSVVRLTDCPNMTIDVYSGRKTTTQQQLFLINITILFPVKSNQIPQRTVL